MSLDDIARHHSTDKSSVWHGYTSVYEREIHGESGSLLELGWDSGASIRMWRDWLPGWAITGLDIEAKAPVPGVTFVHGGQDDPSVVEELPLFDVIVDDASHESPRTEQSFRLLWPHLHPGGLYFIEDLQTSYYPAWGGDENPDRGRTTMNFLKRLADDAIDGHCGLALPNREFDVQRVAFWPGLCLVEKSG